MLSAIPNKGKSKIRLFEKEDEIKVEVIDTGIGIPPKDLPRLFDEFYRGSNVESKGSVWDFLSPGGLSAAHGGKIWAESPNPETGLGSKFVFTIPNKQNK